MDYQKSILLKGTHILNLKMPDMVSNKLLTNDTVPSAPEFENNYIPNSRVDGGGIETYVLLSEKDT